MVIVGGERCAWLVSCRALHADVAHILAGTAVVVIMPAPVCSRARPPVAGLSGWCSEAWVICRMRSNLGTTMSQRYPFLQHRCLTVEAAVLCVSYTGSPHLRHCVIVIVFCIEAPHWHWQASFLAGSHRGTGTAIVTRRTH